MACTSPSCSSTAAPARCGSSAIWSPTMSAAPSTRCWCEGQIVGGFAQGIGGALFEEFRYDEQGQPLSTTFADYLIPTIARDAAVDVLIAEDAPSPLNPLGVKGAGEGGTNAAGAADRRRGRSSARPARRDHQPADPAATCARTGRGAMTGLPPGRVIGRDTVRLEDAALISGRGRFVDDIAPPGLLHVAFVRSPHAHAAIRRHRLHAPRAPCPACMPSSRWPTCKPHLTTDRLIVALPQPELPLSRSHRPVLADRRGRAMSASRSPSSRRRPLHRRRRRGAGRGRLRSAAGRRRLPCGARSPARPTPIATPPHNLVAEFDHGLRRRRSGLRRRRRMSSARALWQHRGGSHSIECRGVVAVARRDGGPADASGPRRRRRMPAMRLLCDMLGLDENRVRVVTPDVGGGFGPKLVFYPEEIVVAVAARLLGRPVKWIEDRREHFVATTQERDQYWDVEIAIDADGRILGVRGALIHDHGAYTARGVNVPQGAAAAHAARLCGAGLSARRSSSRSPTRCRSRRCAAPASRRACSPWSGCSTARRASSASTAPRSAGATWCPAEQHAVRDAAARPAAASRSCSTAAIIRPASSWRSTAPAGPISRRGKAAARARRPLHRHRPRQLRRRHRPRPLRAGHRPHRAVRADLRRLPAPPPWARAPAPCWRRSSPSSSAATSANIEVIDRRHRRDPARHRRLQQPAGRAGRLLRASSRRSSVRDKALQVAGHLLEAARRRPRDRRTADVRVKGAPDVQRRRSREIARAVAGHAGLHLPGRSSAGPGGDASTSSSTPWPMPTARAVAEVEVDVETGDVEIVQPRLRA